MNFAALRVIALNEMRLRVRRLSTLVALLAVVALSWLLIADPATGHTLIVVNGQRALYTSQALAFGSANLAGLLLGLASFYLLRGRVAEDLQSGMGAVIGATQAGSALLALGRWLGGLAYLLFLLVAYLFATLALHGLRGEGPIELLVYLETYALLLVPMACYGAACAVLFDNIGMLVGRAGDVLYFVVWLAQFVLVVAAGEERGMSWVALVDFSGLSLSMLAMSQHFDTRSFELGAASFDAALVPMLMPATLWTMREWGLRAFTTVLAVLPLLPAILLFHRYSPDRVRAGSARRSRIAALCNRMMAPLALLARPLPALAMRLPGFSGEVLAEVALVLRSSPAAVGALLGTGIAALVADSAAMQPVMMAGVACWGVIICGIIPRDWQSGADAMTSALPGGATRRYLRQWTASVLLAAPCLGVSALRLAADAPLRALAVVAGVLALASAAALLGTLTRGSRLFLALFLFAWFVAVNATTLAMADMVGFNGVADGASIAAWAAAGCAAWAAGLACCRWRAAA